jgi:DNA-3-methyladenine glycosylase II
LGLTFAYTLKRRLVETFGEYAMDDDGTRHWMFPSPERIAALQVPDLAGLQMTVKKAEYLIGTAARIAEGSLSKTILLSAGGLASAERILTAVHGIGPWTAHYVAMRCLRFTSALPIQDVGLHLAIQKLLGSDRKPTLAEIRQYASNWAGWESYATFYLWRTLY